MGRKLGDTYPLVLDSVLKIINAKEKLDNLFKNPNRKEIFNLVKKKPLSITQISEEIKLSYNNTHTHVRLLEKYGLVKAERQNKTRGRKVIVHANKQFCQFAEKLEKMLKQKLTT